MTILANCFQRKMNIFGNKLESTGQIYSPPWLPTKYTANLYNLDQSFWKETRKPKNDSFCGQILSSGNKISFWKASLRRKTVEFDFNCLFGNGNNVFLELKFQSINDSRRETFSFNWEKSIHFRFKQRTGNLTKKKISLIT